MAQFEIAEGPHVLFTGANRSKTAGITIKNLAPKSEVEDRGRLRSWSVNTHTLAQNADMYRDMFNLDEMAFGRILTECRALERNKVE